MSPLLVWPGVAVCAVIVAACICRIDMLQGRRSKFGWILLYIMWAPFALGILIDLLIERQVDWWACFGVAGVFLHVILTRRMWRRGAPLETERRT